LLQGDLRQRLQVRLLAPRKSRSGRIGDKLLVQSQTSAEPMSKRMIKVEGQANLRRQPSEIVMVMDVCQLVSQDSAAIALVPSSPGRG
jgi:hypothetical protein